MSKMHKLVSRNARVWYHTAEECFKPKILDLVDQFVAADRHPDPHSCLDFEAEAIAVMNTCYAEANLLHTVSDQDLVTVVNHFRLEPDYYNTMVDTGLVEHIRNIKSDALANSLLSNHTLSMPTRAVMCIRAEKYPHGVKAEEVDPTPEEYVTVLRASLVENGHNVDGSSFHYVGPDDAEELCVARLHQDDLVGYLNIDNTDYHLVSWLTTTIAAQPVIIGNYHYEQDTIFAAIFELTTPSGGLVPREHSRCGDGIRQFSESCDFASSYPACSLSCQPTDAYDCTVEKLAPSVCWLERCGDGQRTRTEGCDDGNMVNGDGCSSTCEVEQATHICSQDYNKTSECVAAVPMQDKQPEAAPAKLLAQATSHVTGRRASSQEQEHRTVQPAANAFSSASKSTSSWLSLATTLLGLGLLSMLR